jgi:hypothetical protein
MTDLWDRTVFGFSCLSHIFLLARSELRSYLSLRLCYVRSDRLDFDLPTFGSRHACSVGGLAHETAGWRTVGHENHPEWNFPFSALKKGLAILGSSSDSLTRDDAEFLHVVSVHGYRIDDGLVFSVILADIDLLALFAGAPSVHDEAPLNCHPPSPLPVRFSYYLIVFI